MTATVKVSKKKKKRYSIQLLLDESGDITLELIFLIILLCMSFAHQGQAAKKQISGYNSYMYIQLNSNKTVILGHSYTRQAKTC